ncbi:MAG TPA: sulfatase [Kofleriaceae bacterium]|nr:sulfatase [Kofleriaceae bacterium]
MWWLRARRAMEAAGGWLADSLLAATAIALGELGALVLHPETGRSPGDLAGLVWVVLGLCGLAAALAGPALLAVVALVSRARPIARWRAGLAEPGGPRVAALVAALVALAAVAAFAVCVYHVARWTHEAFHEPVPIALLESAILAAAAAAAALIGSQLGGVLAPRAAGWRAAARWTSGRRGAALLLALAVAVGAGAPVVAHLVVPGAELERPTAGLHFLLALALVRLARLGAGRRRRLVRAAAIPAALAALTAPIALGSAVSGRASVSAHGAATRPIIALLWRAFDRDGDGFASQRIGGADCDDGDAAVGPSAAEVIGNGRDENCSGRDVDLAALAPRMGGRPSATPEAPRRNVLLITIDSLRADHLGAWGYRRRTSPAIDALAARSTRFAWALTTAPSTRWAISTMSYGRYPSSWGWTKDGKKARLGKGTALPAIFSASGYETHAIMCCTRFFGTATGPFAGIAKIDDSANKAYKVERKERYNGDLVASKVVAWLARRRPSSGSRPFFLWTHFIDPHHPYHHLPGTPEFGKKAVDRYDSEIAFVDQQVGAVLRALERNGLADSTIVALAADHGDEFKEHGHYYHSKNLYNQVLRIPLVVHVPGAPPRVVDEPVSLADLSPTLVDLVGLAAPEGQNGRSHAAAVLGTGGPTVRPVLSELIPGDGVERNLIALTVGCDKLVWDRQANTYQLFSICRDPGDLADRARAEPETVERLRSLLLEQADVELTPLPKKKEAGSRLRVLGGGTR